MDPRDSQQATEALFPPRAWIPCIATAGTLTAGFAAMLLATEGRFDSAVYVLLAGIFLDTLDGRLARWLRATSPFGQQLDSFSDAMAFGMAPAFLVYIAVLSPLGLFGAAAAVLFVLAGVYRLARFNLLSDAHSKARRTMGVPIPIGAGYLMAVTLMRNELAPLAAWLVVVAMAVLMVSRWRLPDLKGKGVVSVMLLVGLCNYIAVVAWPNWATVVWWNMWNVAILMVARLEDRRELVEAT